MQPVQNFGPCRLPDSDDSGQPVISACGKGWAEIGFKEALSRWTVSRSNGYQMACG
jgi:hypothetical protein